MPPIRLSDDELRGKNSNSGRSDGESVSGGRLSQLRARTSCRTALIPEPHWSVDCSSFSAVA
jgi:hypothetical protein